MSEMKALPDDMRAKHPTHWEDGVEVPACFSCKKDERFLSADVMAVVPRADKGPSDFVAPLCHAHSQLGMVAGWLPQHDAKSSEGRALWDKYGYRNPNKQATPIKDTDNG